MQGMFFFCNFLKFYGNHVNETLTQIFLQARAITKGNSLKTSGTAHNHPPHAKTGKLEYALCFVENSNKIY